MIYYLNYLVGSIQRESALYTAYTAEKLSRPFGYRLTFHAIGSSSLRVCHYNAHRIISKIFLFKYIKKQY